MRKPVAGKRAFYAQGQRASMRGWTPLQAHRFAKTLLRWAEESFYRGYYQLTE